MREGPLADLFRSTGGEGGQGLQSEAPADLFTPSPQGAENHAVVQIGRAHV